MTETTHIVTSLNAPDTWYLFREDGTEVKVWLYRGELLSNRNLSAIELKNTKNLIFNPEES